MKLKQEQLEQLLAVLLKYQTKLNVKYDQLNALAIELIKEGYGNISEYEDEIEQLKDNRAKLQELFAKYQLASDKEIRAQVKQAQIDVLNKLRRIAWQGYQIGMYIVSTQEIDELIKEVQNERTE